MAHYAELDSNNIVLRVVVMADDLEDGEQYCSQLYGGRWKQTSYNGNFRARYAGPGMIYDPQYDVFIYPQPYRSWQLDSSFEWVAPVARPGEDYRWCEAIVAWVPRTNITANVVISDQPISQQAIDQLKLVPNTFVVVNSNPVFTLALELSNNHIYCHGNVHQWTPETRDQVLVDVANAINDVQQILKVDVYAYAYTGDIENDPNAQKTLYFSRLVGFTDSVVVTMADQLQHTVNIRRYRPA